MAWVRFFVIRTLVCVGERKYEFIQLEDKLAKMIFFVSPLDTNRWHFSRADGWLGGVACRASLQQHMA